MGRVAIIGDVGGHSEELYAALVGLGADPDDLALPDDLVVIQVGDLIHRGPDETGVLDIVDQMLDRYGTPGRGRAGWVQLVGNHELLYLGGQQFGWPARIGDADLDRLRHWWRSKRLRLAAAVTTAAGPLLVTHAGLTAGLWQQLGSPQRAEHAAQMLNAAIPAGVVKVTAPGAMLGGDVRFDAGVCWAEAASETYGSWLAAGLRPPFGQVHGHSQPFDFAHSRWRSWLPAPLLVDASVSIAARHTVVRIAGQPFYGIDPGHGARPRLPWAPLVLEGDLVI